MKMNKRIQKIIVFLLLIVISCTSVVFAEFTTTASSSDRQGYTGEIEPVVYQGDSSNPLSMRREYCSLTVSSSNSIKFTDENGKTHTLKLTVQNGTVLASIDGSTNSVGTVSILAPNSGIVASVPGNATSQSDGSIKVTLGTGLSETDFTNLSLSFSYNGQSYKVNGAFGGLSVTKKAERRESAGWDNIGALLGDLLTNLLWGELGDVILRLVNYLLNQLLIPLGDGMIGIVSRSVGEVVTIDRLIFGKVDKVSVDYWTTGPTGTVKSVMSDVVNAWYGTFRGIAVIVYMLMLVYVGIMMMLNSTADNKAKYKGFLISWVVGICMLFFFPYVMKYTVTLNNAVVKSMETYMNGETSTAGAPSATNENPEVPLLVSAKTKNEIDEVNKSYGKNAFLYLLGIKEDGSDLNGTTGIMMEIRIIAYSTDQVFLTIIYLILIGEMIVLLVMYYKRAFMVAFLITIFPLVAMTYVIDKAGDRKAQSFEIWFKEYIVNIIVQIFHAVVYVLVVGSAIKGFLDNNGQNWIFVLISVLFLFQGEKILRGIFGMKSAANTIGDLASTGLAVFGVAQSLGGLGGGKKGGDNASEDDKKEQQGAENRAAQRSSMAGSETNAAANARREISGANGGNNGNTSGNGSTSGNYGQDTGNDQPGVQDNTFDNQAAMDALAPQTTKRRMQAGLASRGVTSMGKVIGGTMGATYAMSKGTKPRDKRTIKQLNNNSNNN